MTLYHDRPVTTMAACYMLLNSLCPSGHTALLETLTQVLRRTEMNIATCFLCVLGEVREDVCICVCAGGPYARTHTHTSYSGVSVMRHEI